MKWINLFLIIMLFACMRNHKKAIEDITDVLVINRKGIMNLYCGMDECQKRSVPNVK